MSSPGPPPAAPTFEASKCAWIMARAVASVIEEPPSRVAGEPCRLRPGRRARSAASPASQTSRFLHVAVRGLDCLVRGTAVLPRTQVGGVPVPPVVGRGGLLEAVVVLGRLAQQGGQ